MEFSLPIDRIQAAQRAGAALIRRMGYEPEPAGVALAAEQHRWAWRPKQVRVALIAESHVYTSEDDLALRVSKTLLPRDAQHTPDRFVRLVYCLAYGEPYLLYYSPADPNRGTPQFWEIFAKLGGTANGTQRRISLPDQRIAWKALTMKSLMEKGVWLLDASLHAMYRPGGQRLPARLCADLHRVWWDHYGSWLLEQLSGARIWAVGRTVETILRTLGREADGWIYQPQAARGPNVDMEHGWAELLAAVHGHDGASVPRQRSQSMR